MNDTERAEALLSWLDKNFREDADGAGDLTTTVRIEKEFAAVRAEYEELCKREDCRHRMIDHAHKGCEVGVECDDGWATCPCGVKNIKSKVTHGQ